MKKDGLRYSYKDFVTKFFSDSKGVDTLYNALIDNGDYNKPIKNFYETFVCGDLDWAKSTPYCGGTPKQDNVGGASVGGKLGGSTGNTPKQNTSSGGKLGGGAGEASMVKPSGMRYTPCANLPCQFGTKNPKIREIQTCLGFPLKWQTGNFGPITRKGLKDLQYDLSKGITDEIYNTIKQNCGSANATTPDHPPLNPSGLSPDDTQPGVEGSIYNPDGTLKKT